MLKRNGKIVARVIGWDSVRERTPSGKPKFIIPMKNVTDIRQVPKNVKGVAITVFNNEGRPICPKFVSRKTLEKRYIVTD